MINNNQYIPCKYFIAVPWNEQTDTEKITVNTKTERWKPIPLRFFKDDEIQTGKLLDYLPEYCARSFVIQGKYSIYVATNQLELHCTKDKDKGIYKTCLTADLVYIGMQYATAKVKKPDNIGTLDYDDLYKFARRILPEGCPVDYNRYQQSHPIPYVFCTNATASPSAIEKLKNNEEVCDDDKYATNSVILDPEIRTFEETVAAIEKPLEDYCFQLDIAENHSIPIRGFISNKVKGELLLKAGLDPAKMHLKQTC